MLPIDGPLDRTVNVVAPAHPDLGSCCATSASVATPGSGLDGDPRNRRTGDQANQVAGAAAGAVLHL